MSNTSLFGQLSLIFDPSDSTTDSGSKKPVNSDSICSTSAAQALYDLLGPMGHRLHGIFHRMQIAEKVIDHMKQLNPKHCVLIHQAFGLLYGTAVLEEAPEKLYIAHCQELIHRLIEHEDTRPATMAELISAIQGVSLITPLKRHAIYLYWELFQLVFPDEAPLIFGNNDPIFADEWDRRQAEELQAGLSSKLTVPDRILKLTQ